jgi:SAM-dependent methyltransferase
MAPSEKIEILSVDLLDAHRSSVEALKAFARSVRLEFGWHYLLDMAWILAHLEEITARRIMDAGAGTGIFQWYLASQGVEVISVDRASRAALPLRFRRRFRVHGLRQSDLLPGGRAFLHGFNRPGDGPLLRHWAGTALAQARDLAGFLQAPQGSGQVLIYNQDLSDLGDIPDESLDAVIAVSALEHNEPAGLGSVVQELMRTLKPGGALLATLTAARDQDWWHEASSGWCYTAASLRRLFDLPAETPSNYERYDDLFAALRDCAELRDNLAKFYYRSDCKGMPQGVWDPQYQPVGVCKIKGAAG